MRLPLWSDLYRKHANYINPNFTLCHLSLSAPANGRLRLKHHILGKKNWVKRCDVSRKKRRSARSSSRRRAFRSRFDVVIMMRAWMKGAGLLCCILINKTINPINIRSKLGCATWHSLNSERSVKVDHSISPLTVQERHPPLPPPLPSPSQPLTPLNPPPSPPPPLPSNTVQVSAHVCCSSSLCGYTRPYSRLQRQTKGLHHISTSDIFSWCWFIDENQGRLVLTCAGPRLCVCPCVCVLEYIVAVHTLVRQKPCFRASPSSSALSVDFTKNVWFLRPLKWILLLTGRLKHSFFRN